MQKGHRVVLKSSFEILGLLGEGAFGQVFLVKKNFLNGLLPRYFALKCFHSNSSIEVLRAEAEAMFRVRSKHCVTVHSVEEVEGKFGILMEYVEGITLKNLFQSGDLNLEERNYIIGQVYKGLNDLFTQGLLHSDLNPRNILIDRNGRVVLVDFGLSNLFSDGCTIGSPAYFSPNRFIGAAATEHDDLYALKLIAYDMEAGLLGKSAPDWFWERRKNDVTAQDFTPALYIDMPTPKALLQKVEAVLEKQNSYDRTYNFSNDLSDDCARAVNGRRLSGKRYRHQVLNVLFLSALLVTSPAPSRTALTAAISLRSLSWIQIQFNDGTIVSSHDQEVSISPGIHYVKWQTAKKTGEKTIHIKDKQRLILSDSDFN